jgi:MFS transporter, AAHS family, 4-hydroxybenzoate transporter
MAVSGAAGADLGAALDLARLRRAHWTVLGLAFLVAAFDGLDAQLVAFAAPLLAPEFGIQRAALGPIFSAALVGMAGGAVLFGPLGDRYGRRTVLAACTALFGVGTLVCVGARDPATLIVLRALTGLGLGGALPNAVTLVAETAPRRVRALFVTLMYMGFPAGGLIGGTLAAPLMEQWGWRSLFVLGGIAPLVLVPLLLAWLPESPLYLLRRGQDARLQAGLARFGVPARSAWTLALEPAREGISALFAHGRARNTLLLWCAFFINLFVLFFLMNWLPTLLVDSGLSLERALRLTVLFNLGGAVGALALAWCSTRFNPPRTLALFFAGGAVSFMAIGLCRDIPAGLALSGLATGVLAGGAQVGLYPVTTQLYPVSARVSGVGFAQAWGRVGSILGPLAGGALVALEPPFATYFLVFGAPLLIAALAVAMLRTGS